MRNELVKYLFLAMLVVTLGTAHIVSEYQSQRTDERLRDQRDQFDAKLDTLESQIRADMKYYEENSQIDRETTKDVVQALEGMFEDARAKQ